MTPSQSSTGDRWPELDYPAWRETAAALHLYCQIVGKYRLARTPWVNHSWHATLYPSARGLTTGLVPDSPGAIELAFDLLDHQLVGHSTAGRSASLPLGPTSAADFDAGVRALIAELGGTPEFHGVPNELPDPLPFAEDRAMRPYDAAAVTRYFRALVSVTLVMQRFRTAFLGKVSPVHLFWGSFDLAVTRFSGRRAPPHPGGIPALPDAVTREAYSHEVASAGFWPGGGGIDFAPSTPMPIPPRRLRRRCRGARGGLFRAQARRVPAALRGGAGECRSGGRADGVSGEHLPSRRRARQLGCRRPGMSARPAAAAAAALGRHAGRALAWPHGRPCARPTGRPI